MTTHETETLQFSILIYEDDFVSVHYLNYGRGKENNRHNMCNPIVVTNKLSGTRMELTTFGNSLHCVNRDRESFAIFTDPDNDHKLTLTVK